VSLHLCGSCPDDTGHWAPGPTALLVCPMGSFKRDSDETEEDPVPDSVARAQAVPAGTLASTDSARGRRASPRAYPSHLVSITYHSDVVQAQAQASPGRAAAARLTRPSGQVLTVPRLSDHPQPGRRSSDKSQESFHCH
jgi:hypothetical protein